MDDTLKITMAEFAARRQLLAEKMTPMSAAILPGAKTKARNADADYPFRQESNFHYLTGFPESLACMVLRKNQTGVLEYILFCEAPDPEAEKWTGKRIGPKGAIEFYGANKAYANTELDQSMPELLRGYDHLYYSLGECEQWDKRVIAWKKPRSLDKRKSEDLPRQWAELKPLIQEQRLIKSQDEIAVIRRVCQLSAKAHVELMKQCQPNQREYELEALFLHECYRKGCRAMAYTPIVGGGVNACTLHYTQNDQLLKSGDLVLIDAGGEYQNYAADITRTIPVNGQFTPEQKAIYELVLKAQVAAIEIVRPNLRWDTLQTTLVKILVEGLVALGILSGEIESLITTKAYQRFYVHSSGHWLGLDVHDAGDYKRDGEYRLLEPGMVFTIEPGIYITPGEPGVDKRWWGIGVRIEDDILVTETGYEVLTEEAPKTVKAIERIMNLANQSRRQHAM